MRKSNLNKNTTQGASSNTWKGYFTTIELLQSTYPVPKIGETAWVGTTYPGVVYDCIVSGEWHNTGVAPSVPNVDLTTYIKKEDIVDNLTSTSATAPLSAKQGKVLQDSKVNTSAIVDNLSSTSGTVPLSAGQGKVLNDKIFATDDNEFKATAEALCFLEARIQALEKFIENARFDKLTVDTLDVVEQFNNYKGSYTELQGSGAPTIIPDKVFQKYLDTTNNVIYEAKGTSSVSDWKQTSN